jgi:hypothetical protein
MVYNSKQIKSPSDPIINAGADLIINPDSDSRMNPAVEISGKWKAVPFEIPGEKILWKCPGDLWGTRDRFLFPLS